MQQRFGADDGHRFSMRNRLRHPGRWGGADTFIMHDVATDRTVDSPASDGECVTTFSGIDADDFFGIETVTQSVGPPGIPKEQWSSLVTIPAPSRAANPCGLKRR